jgi:type IV pilus assembly protein PilV
MRGIIDGHEGQEGFSLIEGMLATVVLGVGLLAVAGMQSISLGRNADANELTVATNLAAEMIERIQFNRRNATIYNNVDTLVAGTQPTTDSMAGGDYIQWRDRLNNSGLANVQGRITVTPIGPTTPPLNQSQVTVQITWRGSVKGETSTFVTRNLTLNTIIAPE